MSSSPGPAVRYLALMYLKPGQQERLRQYESRALPVFERIWRPAGAAGSIPADPEAPDEIHVLRFESAAGLDAVRADPQMRALGPLREEIVRKALLLRIEDVSLERYFAGGA